MGTNLGTTVLPIYTNLLGEILRINIKLKKKFYAVAEQLVTKNIQIR